MRSHPSAKLRAVETRAETRNEVIRQRCATPGFGYLVMLYKPDGARHGRDAATYEEAAAIRDAEMASGIFEKSWIIQKTWNAAMSITTDGGGNAAAHDRWMRDDADDL